MDIGFVHPTWPGGEGTGAAHSATQIVSGLRDSGHSITAYCQEAPPSDETLTGVSCVTLDLEGFPYHSATRLNDALTERVDELGTHEILHSYPPSTIPAVAEVGKKTTAATVVALNAYAGVCPKNDLLYRDQEQCTANPPAKCVECILRSSSGHGLGHRAKRAIGRLGNLRLVRKGLAGIDAIDGFRAPSTHVRENYATLGFPAERIRVIPHPLDESFLIEHRSDFSPPIDILYVGYLERQKGVEKLVPVVDGLTDRGFWEEPLARVYIEALATGTPIVTSEYGDVETVIGDGGVTADGSVEGFVDVIGSLIADERLPELSRGADQTIDRYRKDAIIPAIEELYAAIV